MGTEPSSQTGRAERRAQQVGAGQEGPLLGVHACNQDLVPQGIEIGPPLVEDLREVGVQVVCVQGVACCAVCFFRVQRREQAVEVLHVGDVAAEADDGGVGEGPETLDVGEACEGAV